MNKLNVLQICIFMLLNVLIYVFIVVDKCIDAHVRIRGADVALSSGLPQHRCSRCLFPPSPHRTARGGLRASSGRLHAPFVVSHRARPSVKTPSVSCVHVTGVLASLWAAPLGCQGDSRERGEEPTSWSGQRRGRRQRMRYRNVMRQVTGTA